MGQLNLFVGGMSCRRCVREVTALVRDVPGVETVGTVELCSGGGEVTCGTGWGLGPRLPHMPMTTPATAIAAITPRIFQRFCILLMMDNLLQITLIENGVVPGPAA